MDNMDAKPPTHPEFEGDPLGPVVKMINIPLRMALRVCKVITLVSISAMCLVALLQVASRIVPGIDPFSWTEEASLFLMVLMTFSVLPIASYRSLHTVLDMALDRLGALKFPTQVIVNLLCFVTSAAAVYYGWLFYRTGSGTMATTMDWLDRGWIYLSIPISFALMAVVYLQHLLTMFTRRTLEKTGAHGKLRVFDAAINVDYL